MIRKCHKQFISKLHKNIMEQDCFWSKIRQFNMGINRDLLLSVTCLQWLKVELQHSLFVSNLGMKVRGVVKTQILCQQNIFKLFC